MAIGDRGMKSRVQEAQEKLQQVIHNYNEYERKFYRIYMDLEEGTYSVDKSDQLYKEIKLAEHELYCEEYEDNRRRNWR